MHAYICLYIYIHMNMHKYIWGSKIHQVGLQNPPNWGPKSIKLGSKIHQVGVQNPLKIILGRGLGAILAHLGPKSRPRPSQGRKQRERIPPSRLPFGTVLGPNLAPFWEGFGVQVGAKIVKKSILTSRWPPDPSQDRFS